MAIETRSASAFSLLQLAELLNAFYQGYAVPVAFDAPALARRVLIEHIDLAASHVLVRADAPCGVMLVARRGATARLAALGIAPEHRGRGLAAGRGAGVGRSRLARRPADGAGSDHHQSGSAARLCRLRFCHPAPAGRL